MLRLVGYPVGVQLGLPLGDYTDPRAPVVPSAGAFYFVRHPRARRYLLRVDDNGRVRVTIHVPPAEFEAQYCEQPAVA